MRANEILDRGSRIRPVAPAVRCGGTVFSYPEVAGRVGRLASALAGYGITSGDRVAVLHRNCHRFFETYFAALHVGAVLVPLNPRLAPEELRSVLEDAEVRLVISEPSPFLNLVPLHRRLRRPMPIVWTAPIPPFQDPLFADYEQTLAAAPGASPVAVPDDDGAVAHLYYTSGSTGTPKGVVLNRGNLTAHAERVIPELGLDVDTAWAHVAPMFHLAMPGRSGRSRRPAAPTCLFPSSDPTRRCPCSHPDR